MSYTSSTSKQAHSDASSVMSNLIKGDCLEVLGGMDEGCVDLVYLDPPFNTNRDWGEFDDRWGDKELSLIHI